MEQIKFRGKRKDNGEWIYGYFVMIKNAYFIIEHEDNLCFGDMYSSDLVDMFSSNIVNPDTIGQYTGTKDKNDVEIYENDIIEFSYKDTNYIVKIFWDKNDLTYKIEYLSKSNLNFCNFATLYKSQKKSALEKSKIKVIGNIYDNPELLQEKESKNELIKNS
jgi:uncharacterized phage protein (TIGR01671 family)